MFQLLDIGEWGRDKEEKMPKKIRRKLVLQVTSCATKSLPYMLLFHIYANVLSSTYTKNPCYFAERVL